MRYEFQEAEKTLAESSEHDSDIAAIKRAQCILREATETKWLNVLIGSHLVCRVWADGRTSNPPHCEAPPKPENASTVAFRCLGTLTEMCRYLPPVWDMNARAKTVLADLEKAIKELRENDKRCTSDHAR